MRCPRSFFLAFSTSRVSTRTEWPSLISFSMSRLPTNPVAPVWHYCGCPEKQKYRCVLHLEKYPSGSAVGACCSYTLGIRRDACSACPADARHGLPQPCRTSLTCRQKEPWQSWLKFCSSTAERLHTCDSNCKFVACSLHPYYLMPRSLCSACLGMLRICELTTAERAT